jgi:glutathione S-transferase
MTAPGITLHGIKLSGHAHRVELLLEMLQLPYRYVEMDAEGLASPAFRSMNPLGQVPVLRDGDLTLADSNAILVYLVRRYAPDSAWLPSDPAASAEMQRWFSIAAGELRFGPCAARLISLFGRPIEPKPAMAIAQRIFAFMDAHLTDRVFLAAAHPTLADIACYAYTAHAPEGGISLQPFPAIRGWLARVEALPRFKPMRWTSSQPRT